MFTNLGKALFLLRKLHDDLSQAEVAEKAGISKNQLAKYESGEVAPDLESIKKILAALDMDMFAFFYTLAVVEQRTESLGRAPLRWPSMILIDKESVLPRETRAGFARVFGDILALYEWAVKDALGVEDEEDAGGNSDSADESQDQDREAEN